MQGSARSLHEYDLSWTHPHYSFLEVRLVDALERSERLRGIVVVAEIVRQWTVWFEQTYVSERRALNSSQSFGDANGDQVGRMWEEGDLVCVH